jgi:hypothetical protein
MYICFTYSSLNIVSFQQDFDKHKSFYIDTDPSALTRSARAESRFFYKSWGSYKDTNMSKKVAHYASEEAERGKVKNFQFCKN